MALAQSDIVLRKLKKSYPQFKFLIRIIKTSGDRIKDKPLGAIGLKGLFSKELENALLKKEIDLAVHSLKDLPVELPQGLVIGAVTKREKVNDIFISRRIKKLRDLPLKAKIGTSSLRRKAQLLNFRPDLKIIDLRGNLKTRINKIKLQNLDGIVVAYAGVKRLKLKGVNFEIINQNTVLPAVGQAALGLEIRQNDDVMKKIVKPLNHANTFLETRSERALLKGLSGGCLVPLGVLTKIKNNKMTLKARVVSIDGKNKMERQISGRPNEAERLGKKLAGQLLLAGVGKLWSI